MAIIYKYSSRKVLGFFDTDGEGITESGDPYLSSYPDNHYNGSVCPIVITHLLGRYFNACNAIENKNRMC